MNTTPEHGIHRVGDLHLGHRLVAATRGFFLPNGQPDVRGHDHAVIQSIADAVPHSSTLVLYGDNSNNREWAHSLELLADLKAQLHLNMELIMGNHDLIHPMHGFDPTLTQAFRRVFDRMDERRIEKKWDRRILSSHFPAAHGDDDRHSTKKDDPWRWSPFLMEDRRNWFVHAHTHQDSLFSAERPNHICVSWDVRRRPISDVELRQAVLQQMGRRRLQGSASWGELEEHRELAGRWARHEVS